MKTQKDRSQSLVYISISAAFVSVLAALFSLLGLEDNYKVLILATVVAGFSAVTILTLLRRTRISSQSVNTIHEITDNFQKAMIQARGATEISDKLEIERNTLRVFCEKTRSYIDSLSGSHCSVSIQLLVSEANQLYVGSYVSTRNENIETSPKQLHLDRNSQYYEAFHNTEGRSYFYASDLHKTRNYQNEDRYWKEKYRSILVAPIKGKGIITEQEDIIGFLTIDSPKVDAFRSAELVQTVEYLSRQVWFFMSIVRSSYEAPTNAEQIHSVDSLNARH